MSSICQAITSYAKPAAYVAIAAGLGYSFYGIPGAFSVASVGCVIIKYTNQQRGDINRRLNNYEELAMQNAILDSIETPRIEPGTITPIANILNAAFAGIPKTA